MKKTLYFAALSALVASCSMEKISETPNTQKQYTFEIGLNGNADTRIAIEEDGEDWIVNWTEGDKLHGYAGGVCTDFAMSNLAEDGSFAAFTGPFDVEATSARFLYPASYPAIENDKYTASLEEQTIKANFENLSSTTYMMSEVFDIESTDAITLKHLGAALKVRIKLNLADAASYTLASLELNGVAASATIDYSKEVENAVSVGELSTINVNVDGVEAVDGVYTLPLSVFPFIKEAGETIKLRAIFTNDGKSYLAVREITLSEKTAYARATTNVISALMSEIVEYSDDAVLPDPAKTGEYSIMNFDADEAAYDALYGDWWTFNGGCIAVEVSNDNPAPTSMNNYAKISYGTTPADGWATLCYGLSDEMYFGLPNDISDISLSFDIRTSEAPQFNMQLINSDKGVDVNCYTYSSSKTYADWTSVDVPLKAFGSELDPTLINCYKFNWNIVDANNGAWVEIDNIRFVYEDGSERGELPNSGSDGKSLINDVDTSESIMDGMYNDSWWCSAMGYVSYITNETDDPASTNDAYGIVSYNTESTEFWGSWMCGIGDGFSLTTATDPSKVKITMDIKTVGTPGYSIQLTGKVDGAEQVFSYAPVSTYEEWTSIEIPLSSFGFGWSTDPSSQNVDGQRLNPSIINCMKFNIYQQEGSIKFDNIYMVTE